MSFVRIRSCEVLHWQAMSKLRRMKSVGGLVDKALGLQASTLGLVSAVLGCRAQVS